MTAVGWQRVEGGLVFLFALALALMTNFDSHGLPWWAMLLLFFVPDLSFAGYLAGPKVGAVVYNLFHLYPTGAVVFLVFMFGVPDVLGLGPFSNGTPSLVFGFLWIAHVGFDRMLGYGLKEPTGFQDTHLGCIGRK